MSNVCYSYIFDSDSTLSKQIWRLSEICKQEFGIELKEKSENLAKYVYSCGFGDGKGDVYHVDIDERTMEFDIINSKQKLVFDNVYVIGTASGHDFYWCFGNTYLTKYPEMETLRKKLSTLAAKYNFPLLGAYKYDYFNICTYELVNTFVKYILAISNLTTGDLGIYNTRNHENRVFISLPLKPVVKSLR